MLCGASLRFAPKERHRLLVARPEFWALHATPAESVEERLSLVLLADGRCQKLFDAQSTAELKTGKVDHVLCWESRVDDEIIPNDPTVFDGEERTRQGPSFDVNGLGVLLELADGLAGVEPALFLCCFDGFSDTMGFCNILRVGFARRLPAMTVCCTIAPGVSSSRNAPLLDT